MQPCSGQAVAHFVIAKEVRLNTVADLVNNKYPLKLAVDRKGTTDSWILVKSWTTTA